MGELNIDNESAILNKYKLNPNELYVVKCLLYLREGENKYLQNYLKLK